MSDDVKSTNYKTCPYQSDFINAVIRQHLVSVGKRELALFFEKDSNDGLSQDYAAREESLRSAIASMDIDTRAVLAKARLVFNLVHTALPVIENIDAKKNPLRNDFFMQALIREMKENGYSALDMEGFLNTVRIWKSITPHPTEHLNKTGRDLFRQLIEVADVPEKDREDAIISITKALLAEDITPTGKASMMEETMEALEQSRRHRIGIRHLYRNLKAALEKEYGIDGAAAPDLLSPKIRMDVGLRVWHAGDADGKPNADRWALMGTMILFAQEAVNDHLADILKAVQYELDVIDLPETALLSHVGSLELDKAVKKRLRNMIKQLFTARDALHNLDVMVNQSTSATRPDYELVRTKFASLPISQTQSHVMCRNLNMMQAVFTKPDAQDILQESLFILRMHGYASARIETRHNGHVYDRIMDNLFADHAFLHGAGFDLTDIQNISAQGGFSKLDKNWQRSLMAQVQMTMDMRTIKKALFRTNADIRADAEGYPPQTHEFLQRLRLVADHPHMFGMALIAEANDMSGDYQQFFADALGIRSIINTPLPEEKETLESASNAMIAYDKYAGGKNIRRRMASAVFRKDRENFHGLIIPCSDSTKQLGPFAKFQLREAIIKVVDWAYETQKTVLTKEGNGGALGRGGGNGKTFYRYINQEIARLNDHNGRYLNRYDSGDKTALEHASFMSNTEQGRFIRIMSATPSQIAENLEANIAEMMGVRLELQGLAPKGKYIAPYDDFSPALDRFVDRSHQAMLRYRGLRAVKNDDGAYVMDNYAAIVSNMAVAAVANNSARPDSKSKKAKEFLKQRAIGSNIILDHTRMMPDCSLMSGGFLEKMYEALREGALDQRDLNDFLGSPFWFDHLQTTLCAIAQADPMHGMRRLGMERLSHKEMLALGRSVIIDVDQKRGNTVATMAYDEQDGKISPEQAVHAFIYSDHYKTVRVLETFLSHDVKNLPDLDALYDLGGDEANKPVCKIELGRCIYDAFPVVFTMRKAADNQHLERVLSDIMQAEYDADKTKVKDDYMRLISSAQRATTLAHYDIYLDGKVAFGRNWHPDKVV